MMGPNPYSKGFVARLILATIQGMTQEQFVSEEMRCFQCNWCDVGIPLNQNGEHELEGVILPCDASTIFKECVPYRSDQRDER